MRNQLLVLLGVIAATIAWAAGPSVTACSPVDGKVMELFNGKDLTNFYTWLVDSKYQDPDKVITVVDQVDGAPAIRVSGQHFGAFITKEEYSDYHLVVEFRWGLLTWGNRKGSAMDSGILLHCQGPDGNTAADFNGPWMRSVEFQIIQGGVGDFILVEGYDAGGSSIVPRMTITAGKDRDGENVYDAGALPRQFQGGRINWFGRDPDWSDTLGFRGKQEMERPAGQWNRVEAICDGGTITNIVNGKVVNVGTNCSLSRGKIIFQSEGAEIYFRKIQMTALHN